MVLRLRVFGLGVFGLLGLRNVNRVYGSIESDNPVPWRDGVLSWFA